MCISQPSQHEGRLWNTLGVWHSFCRTHPQIKYHRARHLFYFITSCLAIAVGFSLEAFIQCYLSVVALSCAQCTLPRAHGHSDTSHGTLDWCRAAQTGLRFLMQHQQERHTSAFIRSAFKPDAPGAACWDLPPTLFSSILLCYLSRVHSLLPFPLPHSLFLEKGGWERKYSIRPVSANLHFHNAYSSGQTRLLLILSTTYKSSLFN